MLRAALFILCFAFSSFGAAEFEQLELTLQQAESEALKASNNLKASRADEEAAASQADAQFQRLLPQLSLQGNYQYLATVPQFNFGGGQPLQLSHNSYNIGPVLSYTLWDTFSARRSYNGLSKLAESRTESRKNDERQLLRNLRSAYVIVALALEESRLVNDSLALAMAQNKDVTNRFRAGAAARVDLVTSRRGVLNYELQFKQKQAELSYALKDLLSLLDERKFHDLTKPGPPNVVGVTLSLKLDSISKLRKEIQKIQTAPPGGDHPIVKSASLFAESSELSASSQSSKLWPTLQVSAGTSLAYPNGLVAENFNQNMVSVTLSMPLFIGDPTRHLAAEKSAEAEAARYRLLQTQIDLTRDYSKAKEMLDSLLEEEKLAEEDIKQSEEVAKLYYLSYKAGKINLLDVQNADLQALQSKVNGARIDAQILNQIFMLSALSGKEPHHD